MDTALKFKEEGNAKFKEGDIQGALKSYHFALLHVKSSLAADSTNKLVHADNGDPDTTQQLIVLRLDLLNNLTPRHLTILIDCGLHTVCHLKKQNWQRADALASECLESSPKNLKALRRRIKARMQMKQYRRAEQDIETYRKEDPDNAEVQLYAEQLDELNKRYKSREKAQYRRMFGGDTS